MDRNHWVSEITNRALPEGTIESPLDPVGAFHMASEMVAVARWAPERIVTSSELESMIKQADPSIEINIENLTGVRERRVADSLTIAEMGILAAEKVFQQTNVDPSMIDLVIHASVCREYVEPATSHLICKHFGIQRAKSFDISNACLGFIEAWMVADAMIQSGRSNLCLIVGAEKASPYWKMALEAIQQRRGITSTLLPSFTLGDGAAAMILGRRLNRPGSLKATAGIRQSFGEYSDLCVIKDTQSPMLTNARGLFTAALKYTPELTRHILRYVEWKEQDLDVVIPHQASTKVMRQASILTKIPLNKAHVTMDRFGNLASVSVPFTLAEAIEQGRIPPGGKVLIMGYGSGLGVGMMTLTVNPPHGTPDLSPVL